MRLHFPSIAIGVAALSLILISMSQIASPASPPRIEYGPHPRDMIQIKEGTPFTVPPGNIFVFTAIGTSTGQGGCSVQINSQSQELVSFPIGNAQLSMIPVPLGFTAIAGSTIAVLNAGTHQPGTARAWGYLAK